MAPNAANAPSAEEHLASFCQDIHLTPLQCNAIIEDKLEHVLPVFECACEVFKRVAAAVANGEFKWRRLYDNALSRALSEEEREDSLQ